MDTWNEQLETVTNFIVFNNKRPPKTTSIGCWLSDQLCFFRGNKGWAANPEFAERKTTFIQFMNNYEEYLLTRDELWDKKLKEVDDFMVRNNSVPTGTTNKSLSMWWLEQVSQSKTKKMPNNRIDKWNVFIERHNNILNAEDDLWNANLQKSINFIETNKKRPSSASKNSEEKILGQWIINQTKVKTLDNDKQKSWDNFVKTYNEFFLSDDEMWNKRMEETKIFYNNNNKLPSHMSKCESEKKLGTWVQTQKKNLKLDVFTNSDRKTIWTMFITNVENNANEKPIVESKAKPQTIKTPAIVNKCSGKDRHGDCCRNYVTNNTKYCKYHAYMGEYNNDIIATLQFCKACQKWKQIEPTRMQCINCYETRKTYVAELREKEKPSIVLCKRDGCTNKKSIENDYCGIHQLQLFVDECAKECVRPCSKYLKGCRTKLHPEYKRSSCETCLEKERKRDYERRNGVVTEVSDSGTKQCTVCCITKPVLNFQPDNTSGMLTKTCKQCRNGYKIQDAKRDKDHRNELARKAEQKPERIEKKKAWKEENYEKVSKACIDYREREINKNQEEYLNKQADNMKKWRNNNPEKVAEINIKQKTNIKNLYKNHLERVFKCNFENEYNMETFEMVVMLPCYYCGKEINEIQFNGIDRFDNTQGYLLENTVTACLTCNLTKGCLHGYVFWKRILHILSYQSMITNKYNFNEVFPDSGSISFSEYMHRAMNKNMEFGLTIQTFNSIIENPCYVCGKTVSNTHKNGLDRIDNLKGYIETNVKSCCSECNYMKRNQTKEEFFNKLYNIYNNCKNKIEINNNYDDHNKMIVKNTEKKTKEEIAIERQKMKQIKRKAQRDKYSNEEWKKLHIQEFVEKRKQKLAATASTLEK